MRTAGILPHQTSKIKCYDRLSPGTPALESAVHELEDQDARATDRLGAKQRLKSFVFKIAEHVEGATLDVLQKYIEAKMGL